MQFSKIPKFYNNLMEGVPYNYWVLYLENIFKKLNIFPSSIIDVCCGTGTVSEILHKKGYYVCGFDLSEGMIEEAKKNYPYINFFVANAKDFSVNRKFDVAISLFDSLNYIINTNELEQTFNSVYNHLYDDGVFIFDLNTEYALSENLFAQVNLNPDSEIRYIWNPTWDPINKLCTVDMVFKVNDEHGKEQEFKEIHIQKAYSQTKIKNMLTEAGFKNIMLYNAYRFTEPTDKSDRIFIVAKKGA